MAGSLEGRLNRAERKFSDDDLAFLEMESGELVYIGAMRIIDDFLEAIDGSEITSERAELYADALADPRHGSMLPFLIQQCQKQLREES